MRSTTVSVFVSGGLRKKPATTSTEQKMLLKKRWRGRKKLLVERGENKHERKRVGEKIGGGEGEISKENQRTEKGKKGERNEGRRHQQRKGHRSEPRHHQPPI
ncbi:hypothetical protein Sjap_002774 [Stephania japonica]|uniref:Uncharacterized protein n=1 Tax=Stephania japonica TaxID=461633 RepID=A0AAP0KPT8_9MAGN